MYLSMSEVGGRGDHVDLGLNVSSIDVRLRSCHWCWQYVKLSRAFVHR